MTSQIQDSPHPALPPYPDSIAQSKQTNAATTASSGLLNTTLSTTARMAVSSGPTQLDMDKEGRSRRATSVLSMDDIEAAQALEGLRTGQLMGLNIIKRTTMV